MANQAVAAIISRLILAQRNDKRQLDMLLVQKLTLDQQTQNYNLQITTITQQITALRNSLADTQAQLTSAQDNIRLQNAVITANSANITRTQQLYNATLNVELPAAEADISRVQASVQALAQQLAQTRASLESECSRTTLAAAQANQANLDRLRADLKALQDTIVAKQQQVSTEDAAIARLQLQLQAANDRKAKAQAELNTARNSLPSLETNLSNLIALVATSSAQNTSSCVSAGLAADSYRQKQGELAKLENSTLPDLVAKREAVQARAGVINRNLIQLQVDAGVLN